MNSKQKYVLSEEDLRYLISKSLQRILKEAVENEEISYIAKDANGKNHFNMFGAYTRKQNKVDLSNYHAQLLDIYGRYTKIQNDIKERIAMLQSLTNVSNLSIKKPLGEGALKTGLSAYAKFSQKAGKIAQKLGLIQLSTIFVSPEKILNLFKRNGSVTSNDLFLSYLEIVNRLSELCGDIQKCPEILGASVFYNDFLSSMGIINYTASNNSGSQTYYSGGAGFSGGGQVGGGVRESINNNNTTISNERYFDVGSNLIEVAGSIGVTYIPYVGWILGLVDDIHTITQVAAQSEQEQLKEIGNIHAILQEALTAFENVLNKSKQAGMQTGNKIITQSNILLNKNTCKHCGGSGIIKQGVQTNTGYQVTRSLCPYCNGAGMVQTQQ